MSEIRRSEVRPFEEWTSEEILDVLDFVFTEENWEIAMRGLANTQLEPKSQDEQLRQ
jgi:hypothetical protein